MNGSNDTKSSMTSATVSWPRCTLRTLRVLGDFNDAPGQDYFEQNYLAHNVTDILLGSAYRPETLFTHAQTDAPELRPCRPDVVCRDTRPAGTERVARVDPRDEQVRGCRVRHARRQRRGLLHAGCDLDGGEDRRRPGPAAKAGSG